MVALSGLVADFLLVKTALLILRMGVGLPSSDARDGGAARDSLSEGALLGLGEKSNETKAESLSVADATRRSVPECQLRYSASR